MVMPGIPDPNRFEDQNLSQILQAMKERHQILNGEVLPGGNDLLSAADKQFLVDIQLIRLNDDKTYTRLPESEVAGLTDEDAASSPIDETVIGTFNAASFSGGVAPIGTHLLTMTDTIPPGAAVYLSPYEVSVVPLSGGAATIQIGVEVNDPAGILAPVAFGGGAFTLGWHDGLPDTTAATFTTDTTAVRKLVVVIAGASLTAGKFNVVAKYLRST